jgi:hypothetical protein
MTVSEKSAKRINNEKKNAKKYQSLAEQKTKREHEKNVGNSKRKREGEAKPNMCAK